MGNILPVHLKELALSVAECQNVTDARGNSTHACHEIVTSQDQFPGPFQVPEAWAGNLATARVVYLSSNPAISAGSPTAKWRSKRFAEKYPTQDWATAEIADFMINRFTPEHGWVSELRHRKVDTADQAGKPSWGSPEPYWRWVESQTTSLLGEGIVWYDNAVMTEVVHCKSNGEQGVAKAAPICAAKHMSPILAATSAGLLVVVGTKAASVFKLAYGEQLKDKPEFGRSASNGLPDPRQNLLTLHIGGRSRLVCFIKHPNARGPVTTLENQYPEFIEEIRRAAQGEQ